MKASGQWKGNQRVHPISLLVPFLGLLTLTVLLPDLDKVTLEKVFLFSLCISGSQSLVLGPVASLGSLF